MLPDRQELKMNRSLSTVVTLTHCSCCFDHPLHKGVAYGMQLCFMCARVQIASVSLHAILYFVYVYFAWRPLVILHYKTAGGFLSIFSIIIPPCN